MTVASSMDRWIGWSLGVLLLFAWGTRQANAQAGGGRLDYRRVFVPADRQDTWPKGRFQTIPPEEFERLVEIADAAPTLADDGKTKRSLSGAASGARLVSAAYKMRLAEDDLLVGTATWRFVCPKGKPTLVPLPRLELPLEDLRFGDEDAIAGLDNDGRFVALIERSGELQANWRLKARLDDDGLPAFAAGLPPCANQVLTLELPADRRPAPTRGLAWLAPRRADESVADESVADEPAGESPPPKRTWNLGLDETSRLETRIVSADGDSGRSLTVVEDSTYRFAPRGVEVEIDLRLEAWETPLTRLELELDEGLKLTSARSGDGAITWSIATEQGPQGSKVELAPSRALLGSQVIKIGALAPMVLERSFRLPRWRVGGGFWRAGRLTLVAPAPLSVDELSPTLCRQSGGGALPSPLVGESFEFESFSPDATLDLLIRERRDRPRVSMATLVDLSDDPVTGKVVAVVEPQAGETFALRGLLDAGWELDSIVADRPDALATWRTSAATPRGVPLDIQLAHPLAPELPLKLTIAVRKREIPTTEDLGRDALSPFEFTDVQVVDELLWPRVGGGQRLQWRNIDDASLLSAKQLTPARRGLFAETPQGSILDALAAGDRFGVVVEKLAPRYDADIEIEATLDRASLTRVTRIRCLPTGIPVDRVFARFAAPSHASWRWSIEEGGSGELAARELSASEAEELGLGEGGEVWELRLRRPLASPFELTCRGVEPAGEEVGLPLVSIPKAASQRGRVEIRSRGAIPLAIDAGDLRPAPVSSFTTDPAEIVQGAFRFEPSPAGADTSLILRRDESETRASAWVSSLDLASRYSRSGSGHHQATFVIQNEGRAESRFEIPEEAEILGVVAAGVAIPGPRRGTVTIPLEARRGVTRIQFEFITREGPLGFSGRRGVPAPQTELPIMSRRWLVWLPAGVVPLGDWGVGEATPRDWLGRLFWPLGRVRDEAPFDPTAAEDWYRLGVASPAPSDESGKLFAGEMAEAFPADLRSAAGEGGIPAAAEGAIFAVEISLEGPAEVAIVDTAATRSAAWLTFLLTLALFGWFFRGRPARGLLFAALAVVMAGVAPRELAPLGAAALWAILAALVAEVAFPSPRAWSKKVQRRLATAAGVTLAFATAVGWSGLQAAEEPEQPEDRREIHTVLIPVDELIRPTGEAYLAPRALLAALRERENSVMGTPRGSILTDAHYRGKVVRVGGETKLDELRVEFRLYGFESQARPRISLSRELVDPERTATLDGQPVKLDWEADGQTFSLEVEDPGRSSLIVPLRPLSERGEELARVAFAIPSLPTSRLSLDLPEGAPAPLIPSAWGETRRVLSPDRVESWLGAASNLEIRATRRSAEAASPGTPEVEEYLWLKISPGAIRIEARFKVSVPGEALSESAWDVDAGWRMTAPEIAPVEEGDSPRATRRVAFRLEKPATERAILAAELVPLDTEGVGQLRLPTLVPAGAKTIRRWLAVSIDPSLEIEPLAVSTPLTAAEFQTAWGPGGASPKFAQDLTLETAEWRGTLRPLDPRVVSEERLRLVFSSGFAETHFEAESETTQGAILTRKTTAPPEMEVLSASLKVDGLDRTARWTRDANGAVTVFAREPLAGRHRLVVTGRIVTPSNGGFEAPAIRVADAESRSFVVTLLRHEDTAVTIDAASVDRASIGDNQEGGPLEVEGGESFPLAGGRLVSRWKGGTGPFAARVTLAPNEPRAEGTQLVTMIRDDEGWKARVDCRLQVAEGKLGVLRFDIPSQWSGPFEITPEAEYRVSNVAGEERRRLVVWPREVSEASLTLSISGALQLSTGELPRVPDITLLDVNELDRHWIVPTRRGANRFAWETLGLQGEAPEDMSGFPDESPASSLATEDYRVVGDYPQAVLRAATPTGEAARVTLAEIELNWSGGRAYRGRARFSIEPAGADTCPLRLPEGIEVIHLEVDGRLARPSRLDERNWLVGLSSRQLPGRIELWFAGEAKGGRVTRLLAPTLGDLPVDQALWTIVGPTGWRAASDEVGDAISLASRDLRRLAAIAKAVEIAPDRATIEPPTDLAAWFDNWHRVWNDVRDGLSRDDELAEGEALETLDRRWSDLAKRFALRGTSGPSTSTSRAIAGGTNTEWLADPTRGDHPPRAWSFHGPVEAFDVARGAPSGSTLPRRLAVPLAIGVGFVSLAAAVRFAGAMEWFRRWPRAIGIFLGLAWWLWLEPSWLGGAVMVILLALTPALTWARWTWSRAR